MTHELFDTNHLAKTYFKMAVPVVWGLVVTLLYNLADTFFIGSTGNTSLVAGVSLCSPVFTTIMAFGNIYGQGGSSVISRILGKHDKKQSHSISSFCFYIALFTGILLGLFMLALQEPLLYFIGANSDTFAFAKSYFVVLAIGAPFIILSFIHSNLLRCEGLSTHSMAGSILGTVINIILDPILISEFHMGAEGAAIATVIGYMISDVYFIHIVRSRSDWLSIDIYLCKVSKDHIRQIVGIGMTAAITNLMQSLCIIAMNHFLLPYGSERIAAMGIVLKVNMISQLILTGFAFGAVPIFGYLYGSKNDRKLKELLIYCMKFLCSLSLILTALIYILSPWLMRLMMNNASVIAEGTGMLRWQVIGTIFASVVLLLTCFFQAAGKIIPAFILSISRQGVVFFLIISVFVKSFGYQGILISQATADILSALLAILLYYKAFPVIKGTDAPASSMAE